MNRSQLPIFNVPIMHSAKSTEPIWYFWICSAAKQLGGIVEIVIVTKDADLQHPADLFLDRRSIQCDVLHPVLTIKLKAW
jgi:hypothetical protein